MQPVYAMAGLVRLLRFQNLPKGSPSYENRPTKRASSLSRRPGVPRQTRLSLAAPALVVCDPLFVNYRSRLSSPVSRCSFPGNIECAIFSAARPTAARMSAVSVPVGSSSKIMGTGTPTTWLIVDLSKVDTGWFTSNVDACRDILPTIHHL